MRTLVQVTPQDIREGIRKCKTSCPVSKAVDRLGFASVVYYDGIFCYPKGHLTTGNTGCQVPSMVIYKAPRSVTRFVKAFDAGRPVKPFNFFLEAA